MPPLTQHAADEIEAHTSMFRARANASYFGMGLDSAQLVSEWFDPKPLGCTAEHPIDLD